VGRAAIPQWIVDNTRHPLDSTKNWSFKGHEYQIEILKTDAEYLSVIKAAQTGMSELAVRLMLALASLYQARNFMYILPSLQFARRFAMTRVDPVIEHSPQLSREVSKDVDSSEIKRLADSFIYFAGAQKAGQAISVPSKGLVMDEVDFCIQSVLTSFYSRLQHNDMGDSIITRFSTPTLPGYGISEMTEAGSMGVYMVWHEVCGQWVVVDPLQDIALPGWEKDTLIEFSKQDLDDPRLKLDQAYVRCPHCSKPISQDNMVDPAKRAWVHKYPDRVEKSFYVSPLDVPSINTPEKVLRNVKNYTRHVDWINFGLGKAFEDAENSVVIAQVKKAAVVSPVPPGAGGVSGAVMGSDVGKVSHLLTGVRSGEYMDILWPERVRQDGSDTLVSTWKERMGQYQVSKAVVDAGPDISAPQKLIQESAWGQAWACYFTRGSKTKLENISLDEEQQVISAARTAVIDSVVKKLNAGKIRLPANHPETELMLKHFATMKRATRVSETTGDMIQHWTSTSPENHYFFALVYLMIADEMANEGGVSVPMGAGDLISVARVGGNLQHEDARWNKFARGR
jgi:hypothetical protein